jgi:GT2 family glycosyltransferase
MRISVIIATYNRADLLQDCLAQLRRQRYHPGDEVIVADNASTDHTAAVIAEAAEGFPVPLRRIHETTPGKTPALNAGIAAATGEILALTDDDVVVADDWVPVIRQLFTDPDMALAGGRVDPRWERPAPRWLRVEQHDRYTRMSSPLALLHYGSRQVLGRRTAVGANMTVRRDVLEAVGGFAPHLGRVRGTLMCGEDHDFCLRVVAAGFKAIYTPELRVRHWVPAERTRLSYHVRWFFWSGVTNAMLDATEPSTRPLVLGAPAYLWKRLLLAPFGALRDALRGNRAAAAEQIVEGAFAAGYICKSLRSGWERQETDARRQQAPQLPASAQSPAIPVPGVETGKLVEKEG